MGRSHWAKRRRSRISAGLPGAIGSDHNRSTSFSRPSPGRPGALSSASARWIRSALVKPSKMRASTTALRAVDDSTRAQSSAVRAPLVQGTFAMLVRSPLERSARCTTAPTRRALAARGTVTCTLDRCCTPPNSHAAVRWEATVPGGPASTAAMIRWCGVTRLPLNRTTPRPTCSHRCDLTRCRIWLGVIPARKASAKVAMPCCRANTRSTRCSGLTRPFSS